MLSITLIIFFSVALFAYWFRYSCLLILQSKPTDSTQSASDAGLSFPAVQQRLKGIENRVEYLDRVHRDLTNDYRLLCFLLRCSAGTGVDPLERRMLMLDYWIMQGWYAIARRIAPPQARFALEEISTIVNYFAASVSPQSRQRSAAQA
jgi:hypothetical protein